MLHLIEQYEPFIYIAAGAFAVFIYTKLRVGKLIVDFVKSAK